jgi:hypothetical protein
VITYVEGLIPTAAHDAIFGWPGGILKGLSKGDKKNKSWICTQHSPYLSGSPRSRARLASLMNFQWGHRGCLSFRALCTPIWYLCNRTRCIRTRICHDGIFFCLMTRQHLGFGSEN